MAPRRKKTTKPNQPAVDMSETVAQLKTRIAELEHSLEEQRSQEPPTWLGTKRDRKITIGPDFSFDGSRDDAKVVAWLCKIDTQVRLNEKVHDEPLDEEEKLLNAEAHVDDTPMRQYHIKVTETAVSRHMKTLLSGCELITFLKTFMLNIAKTIDVVVSAETSQLIIIIYVLRRRSTGWTKPQTNPCKYLILWMD